MQCARNFLNQLLRYSTIALVLLLLQSSSDGQQRSEREFLFAYDADQTYISRAFDIDGVEASQSTKVIVNFRNVTNKPVQIANAEIGCKCLTAKVTAEKIAPGAEAKLEFYFQPKSEPRSIQEVAQVVLNCADKNTVIFQFKFHYAKFVGFPVEGMVHASVVQDHVTGGKGVIQIPLLITQDVNPNSIKVKASPTLSFVKFETKEIDSRMFLVGTYASDELKFDRINGIIELNASGVTAPQSMQLTLEGVDRFRLFPDSLTFVTSEDNRQTASMMLRIQGTTTNKEIEKVRCTLEDGSQLDVKTLPLSQGIYRIVFTAPQDVSSPTVKIEISHNGSTASYQKNSRFVR